MAYGRWPLEKEREMQFVVWVLAACLLLGVAAFLASVIDRRAGWSKIPLEVDGSENPDEYEIGAPIARRT
jgi:hypothetical protein